MSFPIVFNGKHRNAPWRVATFSKGTISEDVLTIVISLCILNILANKRYTITFSMWKRVSDFLRQNTYSSYQQINLQCSCFKAFRRCASEEKENKKNYYQLLWVANLGGSLILNFDELFAFRYFESVIMFPKVRTGCSQYCVIEGNGCPSNMIAKCFLFSFLLKKVYFLRLKNARK